MQTEPTEPKLANPIPAELLAWMHLSGNALSASDDPVLAGWGRHLLEDWRSLDLLAQRYDRHA